jgi:hypothetical protein
MPIARRFVYKGSKYTVWAIILLAWISQISYFPVMGKTNFYITFAIAFDKVVRRIFQGVAQLVPSCMA